MFSQTYPFEKCILIFFVFFFFKHGDMNRNVHIYVRFVGVSAAAFKYSRSELQSFAKKRKKRLKKKIKNKRVPLHADVQSII